MTATRTTQTPGDPRPFAQACKEETIVLAVDRVLALGNTNRCSEESHRAETDAQQGQRIAQQGQKMEVARRQPVLPRTLPERSIVEALAGLRALAGLLTLDLPMLHECNQCPQRRKR